jgi:type VI secretion system protein ImpK
MKDEIATVVHPVFSYGLRLKDRLEQGEQPDIEVEQAALKGLLLSEPEARRLGDFGGEWDSRSLQTSQLGNPLRRAADSFLGIRYALVCWLDELFILDSPWSRRWNEQKLETTLYGTNLRAELFWEQAAKAEGRPGTDALEVYYLCAMLGFRGVRREEPERLRAWATNTQARIARGQGQELPLPPEHEPSTDVAPRHGRERLQRMVLVATVFALVLVPLVTAWAVKFFLER